MHGRNDVVEGLSGRFDPGLDARRQVNIREASCGLQLANGVGSRCSQGSAFPQLSRQQKHSALRSRQAHIRKPVGVLADPVACRGGGVVRTEVARVHQGLDLEAKLLQIHFVALEHPSKSDIIVR